jgi:hypothetical protein
MGLSETKEQKVATYSLFPVLALPHGFHGSNISFRDSVSPGEITSLQTYSQSARHCPKPPPLTLKKSSEESVLDVYQRREEALTLKTNLLKMFNGMIDQKSMRFRAEVGVCVSTLDKDGITLSVKKALQFYSANAVPFETGVLIRFSYMWAAIAINLNLLAIQCLTDPLHDLPNRLCHISLTTFFSDLLHQFTTGRTFSSSTKLYVAAAQVLNFALLARPSQQMSVFLGCSPVSLAQTNDTGSSNYFSSVIFKQNINIIYLKKNIFLFKIKNKILGSGKSLPYCS